MDLFNNPDFRRKAASLMIAFSVAAPALADDAEAEAETLWKTQTFDAVISLKPCPETGVCGYVYWLNPDDNKLFDYFGDPKARAGRGNVFSEGGGPTREDVKALCGFSPKMHFAEAADGHWQGRMEMRGMGMTVNVDATKQGERELRVVTSKGIFYQTETWVRVDKNDARYPKCKP